MAGGKFSPVQIDKLSLAKSVDPITFMFRKNLWNMTQNQFYQNNLFHLNNFIIINIPIKAIFNWVFKIVNVFIFREDFRI